MADYVANLLLDMSCSNFVVVAPEGLTRLLIATWLLTDSSHPEGAPCLVVRSDAAFRKHQHSATAARGSVVSLEYGDTSTLVAIVGSILSESVHDSFRAEADALLHITAWIRGFFEGLYASLM